MVLEIERSFLLDKFIYRKIIKVVNFEISKTARIWKVFYSYEQSLEKYF